MDMLLTIMPRAAKQGMDTLCGLWKPEGVRLISGAVVFFGHEDAVPWLIEDDVLATD